MKTVPRRSPAVLAAVSRMYWVTVHKTRDINIHRRRVPLAEVYCSVSENFPLVWTNENRELSVEATPACGAAEVGEFATLPALRSFWGWLGFERKGQGAGFQMRGMEMISTPRRNGRGPDSSLKRLLISV